jgi:hypothetical protein
MVLRVTDSAIGYLELRLKCAKTVDFTSPEEQGRGIGPDLQAVMLYVSQY